MGRRFAWLPWVGGIVKDFLDLGGVCSSQFCFSFVRGSFGLGVGPICFEDMGDWFGFSLVGGFGSWVDSFDLGVWIFWDG